MGKEIQELILLLAVNGRTKGIHLVISTSNLSKKVLNPYIMNNFPSRIAFNIDYDSELEDIEFYIGCNKTPEIGQIIISSGSKCIEAKLNLEK